MHKSLNSQNSRVFFEIWAVVTGIAAILGLVTDFVSINDLRHSNPDFWLQAGIAVGGTFLIATLIYWFRVKFFPVSDAGDTERESGALDRLVDKLKDKPGVQHFVPLGLTADGNPLDIDTLYQDKGRTVLLGRPRTGKSTLLHILALRAAEERQEHGSGKPLPFFISLADWPRRQSLRTFLRSHWRYGGDPITAIKEGNVWLFADDLDTLGSARGKQVKQLLAWVGNEKEGPSRVTFACRTKAYGGTLRLPLSAVTLNPTLCEDEVQAMAEAYLREQASDFLALVEAELPAWMDENPLRFMVVDPLRLSILMREFKKSEDGRLPGNHGMLLDRYARELWQRELTRRKITTLPFEVMAMACGSLQCASRGNGEGDAPRDRKTIVKDLWFELYFSQCNRYSLLATHISLLNWISEKSETVPRYISMPALFLALAFRFLPNGIYYISHLRSHAQLLYDVMVVNKILLADGDIVRFQERSMLDYFYARWCVEQNVTIQEVARNWSHGSWPAIAPRFHSYIIIWAGIVFDPNEFIETLIDVDPLLAAKCIAIGARVSPHVSKQVEVNVRQLMRDLVDQRVDRHWDLELLRDCAHILSSISDPSIVVDLIFVMQNTPYPPEQYVDLIVPFGRDAVSALLCALKVGASGFGHIVAALGQIGDPRVEQLLRELLKIAQRPSEKVWLTAALAHMGDEEPDVKLQNYRNDVYQILQNYKSTEIHMYPLEADDAFKRTKPHSRFADKLLDELPYVESDLPSEEAARILYPYVYHADEWVRLCAIGRLCDLKCCTRAVVDSLIGCLADESVRIRAKAIWALFWIGDPRAMFGFWQIRNDQRLAPNKERTIGELAMSALNKFDSQYLEQFRDAG